MAQPAVTSTKVVGRPMLTSADTVSVLHEIFQTKRKDSPVFLAVAPVALGLTFVFARAAAVSQVTNSALGQPSGSSNTALPTVGIIAGSVGFAASLERYTRYTKRSEEKIVRKYEGKHALPKWVNQQLAQYSGTEKQLF